MGATGEQLGRLWRSLDVLPRKASDQGPWQIMDQTDAGAFWCEAGRHGNRSKSTGCRVCEQPGGARQIHPLDPASDLRFCPVIKLKLVEDITCDAVVRVWVPQSRIVGARSRQFLVTALDAERGGE